MSTARSQTISGKVSSIGKAKPLQYASVTLFKIEKNDTIIHNSLVADSTGNYFFKDNHPGLYKLTFSDVNHQSKIISIELKHDTIINVTLIPSATQLEEIKVTGQRPVIERKVDRIVFNVENSILNKGVSTMDLLREIPRIEVTGEDQIKMIGKSSVRVMVDGRMLNLSGEDLRIKLKSLKSDDIAAIEVIPIPPAKYSAEGNSGLINILLKRNPLLGWQGSVNLDYTQRMYASFGESANLSYKSQKLAASVNIGNYSSKILNENMMAFKSIDQSVNSTRQIHNKASMPTASANIEYIAGKRFKLGGNYNFNRSVATNNNQEVITYSSLKNGTPDSTVTSISNTKSKRKSVSAAAYMDLYLDSLKKKKLTLTYNYSLNTAPLTRDVESTIFNSFSNDATQRSFIYNGDNRYRINSYFLDLDFPFHFGKVEAGAAYTFIDNSTSLKLYNIISGRLVIDPSGSNDFTYAEKTPAIYASLSKQISDKWSAKIGLRYENSTIEGFSPTLNIKNSASYGKLFPSVYLLFSPEQNRSWSLSYSKRIERPNFNDLNPFRFYYGTYSYSAGNPYLLPSLSHNLELNYVSNSNLSTIAYYSHLSDGIGTVSLATNGVISSVPENYYIRDRIGIDLSYRYTAFRWWSLYFSANAYLDNSRSYVPSLGIPDSKGIGSSLRLQNTINLNEQKTSLLLLSYNQTLPSRDGFYQTDGYGNLSVNYRFTLPNGKCSFLISGYDMLNQNRIVREIRYETGYLKTTLIPHVQSFSISVNYHFGNKNVKSSERGYKIDKQRAL